MKSLNINIEPDGVNDSVFFNLGTDSPDESPKNRPKPSDSSQNEPFASVLFAQDSSSGTVSSPPQKKTIETAETSEPVTQRPKNKGF